ncbi:hypothetical protein JCM3774_001446 [Rhodotorula dairenensis]
MRLSFIALAAFACGASAVCAASSPDSGSLEALLNRIASQHDAPSGTNSSVTDDVGAPVAGASVESLAPASTKKVIRRSRAKASAAQEKRWVWATAVIQDGAPNAPPIGQNVNQLGGAPVAVTTPAANLPAPSYLPQAQIAAYLNGTAQRANISSSLTSNSSSTSAAAAAQTPSAAVRRTLGKVFGQPKADHRRWIWATSVIQDGAADVPPPGTNANLLGNGAPANTPTATLVSPTFPTEPAVPTTESSLAQPQPTEVAASAPAVAVAGVQSQDASLSSAGPVEPMDAPTAMLFDLFQKLQAGFEELLRDSAANAPPTATSVPTNDKRWIWATSVIQDGATGVPPPGQNANLLPTPAMPATTPAVNLVSPSFPPVASSSSTAAAAGTSAASAPGAFGMKPVQVIAAVPVPPPADVSLPSVAVSPPLAAVPPPLAAVPPPPPVASSGSTSSASPAVSPSRRPTWADNQDLLRASASSVTTSSASPAVSPARRLTWSEHQNLLLASASSASAAARQTTAGQAYRHKQRMIRARRH